MFIVCMRVYALQAAGHMRGLMLGLPGRAADSGVAQVAKQQLPAGAARWLQAARPNVAVFQRGRMLSACAAADKPDTATAIANPEAQMPPLAQQTTQQTGLHRPSKPTPRHRSTKAADPTVHENGSNSSSNSSSTMSNHASSTADAGQLQSQPSPNTASSSSSQQRSSEPSQAAVQQAAAGHMPSAASKPARPRPRRSSSASMAVNDVAAQKPKVTTKKAAAATNGAAIQQPPASSSPASSSPTAAAGAAATPAPTDSVYQEPNMALRNAFRSSNRAAAALVGPSQPISPEAGAWCGALGIDSSTLEQWRAGMATVQHPLQQGKQVEVLALPYYRGGRLVDVRYLQLCGGQLVGSWLAVGACQMYTREEALQVANMVVFVSCELDALLLSAAGVAAIAVPQQTPWWDPLAPSSTQQQQQQQVQEVQQQQQLQQDVLHDQHQDSQQPAHQQPGAVLPPLQQLLQCRHRLQYQQQHGQSPEDPRLRLAGLTADLASLRRQYEIGATKKASSSSSGTGWLEEGLVVSDVSQAPVTGLSLLLPAASTAVLAMDEGPVGDAVGNELAALLGEVSCRHVQWPDFAPADAAAAAAAAAGAVPSPESAAACAYYQSLQAQLLAQPGESGWTLPLVQALQGLPHLLACIDGAYVWPIAGLERFSDYAADLLTYWETPNLDSLALSTGWACLDEYYKVGPGEVTLVSGVPNSGKSEWLDALAVNLAHRHGWRFAVCSMEKRPRDHAKQLVEKIAGRPLLRAAYAEDVPRMTEEELQAAYRKLCDHFVVIASGEDSMPSISWVLEKAKAAKIQHGINGLIVDPYNELDPTRGANLKEHEHVNELMGRLRKFARENSVHCWLVAHPRQMSSMWQGQRPGLQDISGGANFMNKTDNGIIVHRDWARMKELQQRAAANQGAGAGGGGSGGGGEGKGKPSSRKGSESVGAAAEAGKGGSTAGSSEAGGGDSAGEGQQYNQEFEVQIIVEKVRNKTTGCKGECVLVYDRVTGRYHEPGQEPDRVALGADVLVPGAAEVVDDADALAAYDEQQAARVQQVVQWVGSSSSSSSSSSTASALVQGQQQSDEEVLANNREAVMNHF